jgi:hypothetical protein
LESSFLRIGIYSFWRGPMRRLASAPFDNTTMSIQSGLARQSCRRITVNTINLFESDLLEQSVECDSFVSTYGNPILFLALSTGRTQEVAERQNEFFRRVHSKTVARKWRVIPALTLGRTMKTVALEI